MTRKALLMQCFFHIHIRNSNLTKLFLAFVADIFTTECHKTPGRSTEGAGRLKLLQHDFSVVNKNLHFIANFNIQSSAKLNGQHNSAQFIHFTNNSSRFHEHSPTFLSTKNPLIFISTRHDFTLYLDFRSVSIVLRTFKKHCATGTFRNQRTYACTGREKQ